MKQYSDLPMDLADASLVLLAEEIGHGRIVSTDRRDFHTYRWKNRYLKLQYSSLKYLIFKTSLVKSTAGFQNFGNTPQFSKSCLSNELGSEWK